MRRSRVLAMFLIAVMILSACQSKKSSKTEKEQKENTKIQTTEKTQNNIKKEEVEKEQEKEKEQEVAIAPEIEKFFADYVNSDSRPVAVMVDNDNDQARPQAGLDEAYLIYEMVVEGRSTRFMAFFKNANTAKIGPVRSSRHYFLDYVMENDAIYTHYGWSPKAMTDIPALGINNINGINGGDDSIFWRERKFKGDWHSAFTSIEKIAARANKKGYKSETENKNGIVYSEKYLDIKTEKTANNVKLNYAKHYSTGYNYNSETKLYEKTINGKSHKMQNGETLKFKNVIIMLAEDTPLGDGSDRRNINTTGSGKGYYITDGYCKNITWSKSTRSGQTVYKDEAGNELVINPGKTIINIISPSAGITIG